MTLDEFKRRWPSLNSEDKKALADQLHTSVSYLSNIVHGHRTPSSRFMDLLGGRLNELNRTATGG